MAEVPVNARKRTELAVDTRTYDKLLRAVRRVGECGFALVTQRWKTLQRVTCRP